MSFFFSALVMGVLSSGHCLGMCGPLVLALPVNEKFSLSVFYRVFYNIGRVFSYAVLGALVGFMTLVLQVQQLQAALAQLAGIFLITIALVQLFPGIRIGFLSRLHSAIVAYLAPLLQQAGRKRFFVLGMLNGILPCGMVAAALVVSLAAESWLSGVAYMLIFGLGTFPLMMLASIFGIYLSGKVRRMIAWLGPIYAAALGMLLLARPGLIVPHCTH